MKSTAITLLAVSLALIALGFGLFHNLTGHQPGSPVIVIPLDPTSVQLQSELVNQQATAEAELQRLELSLSEQQTELHTRKAELENEVKAARQQLGQLRATQQALATRLTDLERVQAGQSITTTTELEAARSSYLPRR
ncbi:MAG TPA: hypothetical protein PKD98_23695, partial [Anaerolineae bacterium]|nr:hypothetical protein [Anaerolineae bacterium]